MSPRFQRPGGGDRPSQDTLTAWLFLAPALTFLGVFVFFPIAYLAYLSLTQGSFTRSGVHWVGLGNYERLLATPDFWQVLGNTVYFTVATVLPSLILPLGLAVLLNRAVKFRDWLRAAYFIPSITSLVAVGLGWRWLFQTDGPVNAALGWLGIAPIPWLGSTTWAMPVLILFSIWKQLGFNLVVFLAGLQTIPQSRYEAAELDGANDWQQFWHITLPGLRPTLVFAIVTTTLFTLRSFEQPYVITGGGPLNTTNLLVYYVYTEAFAQFDFGYAAAAATLLLLVTLLLVYLQFTRMNE
ncbi:carbohydrate ABC transporter permease [Thermoleptolyngbya sp. C42_A2020_037]|uniref:carbohydrate ABC transporter permease n=1 Tax=Thermoleptolyngbya sp. C42_A2020_037 TaxID=2747799 RepID=UPI0019FCFA25|nr:sugar ABC transporter permease [Thermoleptolyngbya sp. C42_A2020_037]MBF2085825.1 sugar ABC transporter permease [Thermoleptolyngbya sp. C42_A2020_037]